MKGLMRVPIVLAIIGILYTLAGSGAVLARPDIVEWRYTTQAVSVDNIGMVLNRKGASGWELVAAIDVFRATRLDHNINNRGHQKTLTVLLVFKKPRRR